MTQTALNQISRKPHTDKCIDRQGYALAGGIALGLINLRRGQKIDSLKDLKLDQRLINLIEGGKGM